MLPTAISLFRASLSLRSAFFVIGIRMTVAPSIAGNTWRKNASYYPAIFVILIAEQILTVARNKLKRRKFRVFILYINIASYNSSTLDLICFHFHILTGGEKRD